MNNKVARSNFEYCQDTLKAKYDLELSYLDLASRLYNIHRESMFEPNYETFDEFLEELKISRFTANRLINIWSRFILEFKIRPKVLALAGGWSIVAEILPHVENKKQAEHWLHEAQGMRQRDLRKNLKEKSTGIDMRVCKHRDYEVITFKKCNHCGETIRIYEVEGQT